MRVRVSADKFAKVTLVVGFLCELKAIAASVECNPGGDAAHAGASGTKAHE
jgi:hypothetical protein